MLKKLSKKNILSIVLAGFAALNMVTAQAALDGAYVGGLLGYGNVHDGGFDGSFQNESNKDTGLAGRVFAGYQFFRYFALETGYSKFHNAYADGNSSGVVFDNVTYSTGAHGVIRTDAFDIVGKAILPLQHGFSVYGKLGAAYLRGKAQVNYSYGQSNSGIYSGTATDTENRVLPTFGLGVGYDMSEHVSADVSWNRIQKVGDTSLGSTDLVGVGLGFHFG